jgi:nicotinamide-nucleotide amidase
MVTPNQAMTKTARALLALCKARKLKLAAAESCTGGLLTAALTEIPGSSEVIDRGFVTYSNESKHEMLGVPTRTLEKYGAVSRETALAMAKGALANSLADITVAITGIAGPGGGSKQKPVGLVHIAAAARGGARAHRACKFGDIGRAKVRENSVLQALAMLNTLATEVTPKKKRRNTRK